MIDKPYNRPTVEPSHFWCPFCGIDLSMASPLTDEETTDHVLDHLEGKDTKIILVKEGKA